MLLLITLPPWIPWAGSMSLCTREGHGSANGILFLSPAQAEGTELRGRMPHCPASQQVTPALLLQKVTFSSSSSRTSLTSELYPRSFQIPPALGERNYFQRCLEINEAWVMAGTHPCQDHHSSLRLAQSCLWGCWLPTPICYNPAVKRQDVEPTNCSSAERK